MRRMARGLSSCCPYPAGCACGVSCACTVHQWHELADRDPCHVWPGDPRLRSRLRSSRTLRLHAHCCCRCQWCLEVSAGCLAVREACNEHVCVSCLWVLVASRGGATLISDANYTYERVEKVMRPSQTLFYHRDLPLQALSSDRLMHRDATGSSTAESTAA